MEKEMLVLAKFKEGEGKFEKFMGFMQSPEGLAERQKVAVVEKTVASVTPDKSEKYATKMFNKKFLMEKGLPFPNWID